MPRQVDFLIRGMTCAARVERKLNAIDSVQATVNFATERATVTAPVSVPVLRLIEAVEEAGYGAEAIADTAAGTGGSGPARAARGGPDAERVVYLRNRLIVAFGREGLLRQLGLTVPPQLAGQCGPGRRTWAGQGPRGRS